MNKLLNLYTMALELVITVFAGYIAVRAERLDIRLLTTLVSLIFMFIFLTSLNSLGRSR